MIQTILHLSDTHGQHRKLKTLPDADVLVHSGDFAMAGTEKEILDFLDWFIGLPHPHKIFIAGNHDDFLYQANIEGLPGNTHYLCNSGIEIDGIYFYGLPMFVADDMSVSYKKQIVQIPHNTDVLISHQPPLGIRDYVGHVHLGSCSLLKQVTKVSPLYHLYGHAHEAHGMEKIGHTVYINSALTDNHYQLRYEPILLKM